MSDKIDISYAIGLEPERAIEYLRSKGYIFSGDWYEVWQEAHGKAFTVAKATQADVLQDIRGMVDKALKDGITLDKFKKELKPKLISRGWWGKQEIDGRIVQLGSMSRLETIYRTNTQTAYNAGRYKDQWENRDARPYWQYVAVMDAKTRPTHAALNGKVFRADDKFWNTHYPPCGFNCRCRVRALTEENVKSKGLAVFDSTGKLFDKKITVAKGVEKTVTEYRDGNIKMAPDAGWNYNPGKSDWEPEIGKYAPDIQPDLKSAEAKYGLAKRFSVKSVNDLQPLLDTFDFENPGIFKRGFKKIVEEKGEDYFMATDSHGKIYINNHKFTASGDTNSAKDLISAINKIKDGKDLTFNEEYSVESLWHEILHNRAEGWTPKTMVNVHQRVVMETLNQYVARHTYPSFLEALGGVEAHGENVLLNGYGYNNYVQNFRTILKVAKIDENKALPILENLSYTANWDNMPNEVAKTLAGLYGDKKTVGKFLITLNYLRQNIDIEAIVKIILGAP